MSHDQEASNSRRESSIKLQIKKVIINLIINSSTHGLPNILRAKIFIIKILWIMFFILSACFCMFLVYKSIMDYLDYEVVTKIRFIREDKAEFPTITICNKSPFTSEYSIEFLIQLFQNLTNKTTNENIIDTSLFNFNNEQINNISDFNNNTKFITRLEFFNNLFKNDMLFNLALTTAASNQLTDNQRKRLSYSLDEMLINCKFVSLSCKSSDFEWYYHFYYGNCYVFNSNIVNKVDTNKSNNDSLIENRKFVNGYGLPHSLQLELFVGIPDMYPNDLNDLGVKIIINNRTSFPLIGKDLDLNVGTLSNIAIDRIIVDKLKKPYSDCDFDLREATIDSFDSELYKLMFSSKYAYRYVDCMVQCYQRYLINNCKCYDLSYFNVMKSTPCLTIEQNACLVNVYGDFVKKYDELCEKKACPLECNDLHYTYTSSFTDFPTRSYANFLRINHSVLSKYSEKDLSYEQLKQSVLKVNFYYESLNFQHITELPNTTMINLLASIGGALGLCLGVSCLSFIEIFEIIAQIFLLMFKKITI